MICFPSFNLDHWFKDESTIERPCSNVFYLYSLSLTKNIFLEIWLIQPFGQHNPWISYYLSLLESFSYPRSTWNWDFAEGEGRIRRLNFEFLFFIIRNEKPWSRISWIILSLIFGLDFVFSSSPFVLLLDFNFDQFITLILLNFITLSLHDWFLSPSFTPWFHYEYVSKLSDFLFYGFVLEAIILKIIMLWIFQPNPSSKWIEFWRYLENFPNSLLIRPLLTIILINS